MAADTMTANEELRDRATELLHEFYGSDAEFHEGQLEAIASAVENPRTLVVQKTGWGKSLVYFIATKILRERGKGLTLVVSPLLSLMGNQYAAANEFGIKADVLCYETSNRRGEILAGMKEGSLDLVLVTPETLFNGEVQAALEDTNIGLFVIDEAHCISDWGHDFRLEYTQLRQVINNDAFADTHVLATTATATQRVIEDLCDQMGENLNTFVGDLSRDEIHLQVIHAKDKAHKYAWILDNINELPGTGIIYCTTRRDCRTLSEFLSDHGVDAVPYYAGVDDEKEKLESFNQNKIKAIVATTKLGMGYDKDDVGFVIHFQLPSNIIAYYQQIGRAGRKLDNAYAFLLAGDDVDLKIQNYFIDAAFPSENEMSSVLEEIRDKGAEGASAADLGGLCNMRQSRISKALDFLVNLGLVYKKASKYYPTPKQFVYDRDHYKAIEALRRSELEQMVGLATAKDCLVNRVLKPLARVSESLSDGASSQGCGHCANCLGRDVIEGLDNSFSSLEEVKKYLTQKPVHTRACRRKWFKNEVLDRGSNLYHGDEWLSDCLCLSFYGDFPYGELVSQNKYSGSNRFDDVLLERSYEVLKDRVKEWGVEGVACVPSLRSDIVSDFAKRLADKLGVGFYDVLRKDSRATQQQKDMQNSYWQEANALRSFYFDGDCEGLPDSILLVDDMVDSGWTLTVCAALLAGQRPELQLPHVLPHDKQGNCKHVYPFALADSSNSDSNS